MKNLALLFFLISFAFPTNAQNKWTVLAGGTPEANTPAPYFSPSQLMIQVGDTVVWRNIQGWHDVTTTSGPENFNYAPAGSGWTHEFVFTQEGVYDYECSVGTHALTQFGSITVVADQKKYTVVAGGTPDANTPAPYFSPSLLTIQTGDTVVWNNIQGWHDVTTTSGPENFNYAPAGSGWTHEFVFTQEGIYDYECSVGTHALTQFGTITVEATMVSTQSLKQDDLKINIYPNPTSSYAYIDWNKDFPKDLDLIIFDITGKEVYKVAIPSGQNSYRLDVSSMAKGVYGIALQANKQNYWNTRLVRL